MHVGGKHGHNHAALGLLEHIDKSLADFGFAHGVALALHVGGFAQKGQHALAAQLGKARKVGYLAVDGGKVDLEIAREHNGARRAGDGNGHRTGNGVVYMQKAHGKAAQAQHVAGLDHVEGHTGDAVLLELEIHQRQRQLCAVQRHGNLAQHIGRGADMVLVAVGKQHAADPLAVFDQIRYIRNHQVNAQHVFLGENGTAVHHQHIFAIFDHGDIFTKFIYAAKRDDAELLRNFCHWSLLTLRRPREC